MSLKRQVRAAQEHLARPKRPSNFFVCMWQCTTGQYNTEFAYVNSCPSQQEYKKWSVLCGSLIIFAWKVWFGNSRACLLFSRGANIRKEDQPFRVVVLPGSIPARGLEPMPIRQWWALKRWNYQIIFRAMIFSEKSSSLVSFFKFRCVDCSKSLLFGTLNLSIANFFFWQFEALLLVNR
jgi:hypothetical protein